MNPEMFIREVIGYYAGAMPYSPQQKQAVWNWIQAHYNRDNEILSYVYTELLNTLSPKYRMLPAITELNEALKIARSKRRAKQTTNTKLLYPPEEERASPEVIKKFFEDVEKLIKFKRFKGVKNGKNN